MSRAPDPVAPPLRPISLDYFFMLVGCSLSLFLLQLHPVPMVAGEAAGSSARGRLLLLLPQLMRLPEGLLLMWPIFLTLQRLRGRPAGLTGLEWLWVLSWLGVAGLALWSAVAAAGVLPSDFPPHYAELPYRLWYFILVPSMAILAIVIEVLGLLHRGPSSWTHTLGLVLLLWPIAPLLGILALGKL